jgi:hypothetical protein
MTKDQYFEMCELLGSTPIESEIPVEFSDLPLDVQEAYSVYSMLPDSWDFMSGTYVGKNYAGLGDILEILGVEDKLTVLNIIELLDRKRSKAISINQANARASQPDSQ